MTNNKSSTYRYLVIVSILFSLVIVAKKKKQKKPTNKQTHTPHPPTHIHYNARYALLSLKVTIPDFDFRFGLFEKLVFQIRDNWNYKIPLRS